MPPCEIRQLSDGSIDFGFYRLQAKRLRLKAVQVSGHKLRQRGQTAAASLSIFFTEALGALLDRMFPKQPPQPRAR